MARKSKKSELAKQQDAAAPFLFDADNLPMRVEVVQCVKSGSYKHTGARLLDNDRLALRLVELLMLDWPVKRIAEEMKISPKSVRAARAHLVLEGKLAPYKERIVGKMEDIIEVGLSNYLRALEAGTVPAAQIPVGVGIISDKRALAMGEPTSIAAGPVVQAEDLSVDKLNAYVAGLAHVKVGTGDLPSTDKEGKGQ